MTVVPGVHSDTWPVQSQVDLSKFNWIAGFVPPELFTTLERPVDGSLGEDLRKLGRPLSYRIRHRQRVALSRVTIVESPSLSPTAQPLFLLRIWFEEPQRAVAPGQVLVLYDGDVCLGGGAFVSRGPSYLEMGKAMPQFIPNRAC